MSEISREPKTEEYTLAGPCIHMLLPSWPNAFKIVKVVEDLIHILISNKTFVARISSKFFLFVFLTSIKQLNKINNVNRHFQCGKQL